MDVVQFLRNRGGAARTAQLQGPGGVQGRGSSREPEAIHLSCGSCQVRDGVVDHARCAHPGYPYLPLAGLADLEARQVKKDRHRDNASVRGGLLVLRYYYEDVVFRPEEVVNEILTVLRHREVGHFAPARYAPGWVPPS